MNRYGKLTSGNRLEFAPQNKGSILNYNLNEELMKRDGYKEVIDNKPSFSNYIVSYEETEDTITVVYTEVPIQEETAEEREARFNHEFLRTSKGAFRLQPKGFANALQALDFINTQVEVAGAVTEQIGSMVIFYEIPDFTKAEECIEDWLVAHQVTFGIATKEEWQTFYLEATQLYIMQQYK